MAETFHCSACGTEFLKAWTDEEAAHEQGERFPGISLEVCKLVCDACYLALVSPEE